MARILIVDDEPSIRKVLRAHLRRAGHQISLAADGAQASGLLSQQPFELVVSDLKMPGMDGMELLAWCRQHHPGLPVILITAHGTVDSAVEAIKLGAHDYITKPFDQSELQMVIDKALGTERARRSSLTASSLKGSSLQTRDAGRFDLIGRTPRMQSLYRLIERVADSPTSVLITGESGTGKELVARALHANSSRRDSAFIQVNCGAIPEQLFESELFGHERGAFTGAVSARPGRFELAHGGTIFLDEIGELSRDMQVKLLRVLQERRFERVGGIRTIEVDIRLIAATNRSLPDEIRAGRFRDDLYYRLSVLPIALPSLRDRIEDIPLLTEHFRQRFNAHLGRDIEGLSPDALDVLMAHSWPGNIRELENLMERTILLCDGPQITAADLYELVSPDAPPPDAVDTTDMGLKEFVRVYTVRLERARIQRVLEAHSGNVTHASKKLGISRKSLQTKMKEYGLRQPSPSRTPEGTDPP